MMQAAGGLSPAAAACGLSLFMGEALSFSMAFYRAELRRLAETPPTVAAIYRARTLLKMLDDLADEGYTTLNEQLESGGNGATWLRDYLRKNHAEPFPRMQSFLPGCDIAYGPQRIPLETAIRQVVAEARTLPEPQGLPCVNELRRFCQWVGYEPGTAYIFLLRDTLLPFVYYQSRGVGARRCIHGCSAGNRWLSLRAAHMPMMKSARLSFRRWSRAAGGTLKPFALLFCLKFAA